MKKIISYILIVATLLSVNVQVFAAEETFEIDTVIEEISEEEMEEIVVEEEATVEPFATVSSGTCGANGDNLTWTLDYAGTLTISGTGEMENWTSSSSVPWYSSRSSIKKVVIENGVTSIGGEAFSCCTGLTEIEIPSSVTSIGEWAFYYCYALTEIEIPSSVTSIGNYAFHMCDGLTEIEIPASITSIGDRAFSDCSKLTAIKVNEGNTKYCDIDGVLFSKDKTTLIAYPGGGATTYKIPSSVTSIGKYAFYECYKLAKVEFEAGSKLTSIGYGAFYGCSSLTEIEIPSSVTSIGDEAFYYCDNLKKATVLSKTATIGSDNFKNCHSEMTLYGYAGSTTETYAKENNIPFVAIEYTIPGDVTGDGIVTRNDLLRLAKHFSGFAVEIDEEASDVTGDGIVNRSDLLRLAKYFSGFDVTLGK